MPTATARSPTGKAADILILDANPLKDIAATRAIRGVVLKGQWLDRAALDAMLAEATAQRQLAERHWTPRTMLQSPRINQGESSWTIARCSRRSWRWSPGRWSIMLWMAVTRVAGDAAGRDRPRQQPRRSRRRDLDGKVARRGPVEVAQLHASDGAADALLRDRLRAGADGHGRRRSTSGSPGAMSACASSTAWSRRRSTSSATASRCSLLASLCLSA